MAADELGMSTTDTNPSSESFCGTEDAGLDYALNFVSAAENQAGVLQQASKKQVIRS